MNDDDFDLLGDDDGFGGEESGHGGFDDFEGANFKEADFGSSDFGNADFGESEQSFDSPVDSHVKQGASYSPKEQTEEDDELEFEEDQDDFLDEVDNVGKKSKGIGADPLKAPEDELTEKRNTALFAIAVGTGILIVVLICGRLLSNHNKVKNGNISTHEVESIVEEDTSTVTSTRASENVVNAYTGEESWVAIDSNTKIPDGLQSDGVFTVTDVKHFAKPSNSKNDKQIKSIVTGNISGLVGTFEFEIPFSKASKLSGGVSFKVSYSVAENNGYKVVEVIDY